jgi:hypothetical protein
MTPTLRGRMQTRIFVLWTIGLLLTIFYTVVFRMFLADPPPWTDIAAWNLFLILGYVTLFGLGWDILYMYIQSFHWDRDWPLAYQLLSGIPEGLLVYVLFAAGWLPGIVYHEGDWWRFLLHYGSVWLLTYLWLVGPMRIVFVRWRFRGGEIL